MRFKSVVRRFQMTAFSKNNDCTSSCSEVREKKSPDSQSLGYMNDFFYKKLLIRVSREPDGQSRQAAARESGR